MCRRRRRNYEAVGFSAMLSNASAINSIASCECVCFCVSSSDVFLCVVEALGSRDQRNSSRKLWRNKTRDYNHTNTQDGTHMGYILVYAQFVWLQCGLLVHTYYGIVPACSRRFQTHTDRMLYSSVYRVIKYVAECERA